MFRDFLDVSETTWAMVEQSWVDTNRACDEFMAELRAEQPEQRGQSMVLRYEDFLRDPAGATRGVCEALLGVEWAEGMANPYETSAIQSFEAAESKSTTDQKLSSEQLKFDRPQSRTGSHYLTGGTMSDMGFLRRDRGAMRSTATWSS